MCVLVCVCACHVCCCLFFKKKQTHQQNFCIFKFFQGNRDESTNVDMSLVQKDVQVSKKFFIICRYSQFSILICDCVVSDLVLDIV